MKKTLMLVMLVLSVITFGAGQAFAVTVVPDVSNGAFNSLTEWANQNFPYYMEVLDGNELAIPDAYDIKRVVLLQEHEGFAALGYDSSGVAGDDGIYLMIETWAAATMQEYVNPPAPDPGNDPNYVDSPAGGPTATLYLDGDFGNPGPFPPLNLLIPGIDFSMAHTANAAGGNQAVNVTFNVFGPTGSITTAGGAFTQGTIYEYFIPSGPFGTPAIPFPRNFLGTVTLDNGGAPQDDVVVGQLPYIPEPATMFLLASGLVGLFGFKKFSL